MKTTKPAISAGYCGENNKAPRFCLGALNLFHLRREQQSSEVLPRSFESCGENRKFGSATNDCEKMLNLLKINISQFSN